MNHDYTHIGAGEDLPTERIVQSECAWCGDFYWSNLLGKPAGHGECCSFDCKIHYDAWVWKKNHRRLMWR